MKMMFLSAHVLSGVSPAEAYFVLLTTQRGRDYYHLPIL